MRLPRKSKEIDIKDVYAVKLMALWTGFKQEGLAFWAFTAYFFFEYVRPQSIYTALEVVPWAQITLIVALLSAFSDRTVKWVSSTANKYFILFFLIIILSSVFAFKPAVSWANKEVMINWLLVYFLLINIVNTERRLYLFLLAYLIFNFKMSQHGFFSWAGRGFSFSSWGLIGAGGWFQNSSEFTIQMLIFGSLSAAFVMALKDYWGRAKKLFFYFMPFTAFMTILGASSRGAQLALMAMIFVLVLRLKVGVKVLMFLVVAIMLAVYFLPEDQIQRFTDIGEDKNSTTRLSYWKFGLQVIQDHPVLGVGYRNWLSYANFSMPNGIFDGRIQLPHNIYIEAGAELGLAGLLCFLVLVINVFIINARTRSLAQGLKARWLYFISYGLDFGLVGYLVAGTFVTVLYYPFFWVQIAMTVALYNVTKKQGVENKEVVEGGDNCIKRKDYFEP